MRNFQGLFNLVFVGAVLVAERVFGAESDKEQIRQALESKAEDITELSDFWNCISTQVIRDKFSWNRVHRTWRYESMPLVFPSAMKEQLQSVDILDPRSFYLGCVGILKLLESKRVITSGYENELEKSYSRKTFCISAAEYCFPVKGRLKVVKDYFTKVAEGAREAVLESKEREISEKEKEEIEKLADRTDLKLLREDPDFGKPQHHPLMEERIRSKRIQKSRLNLPEPGRDLQTQQEFLETALEEVPLRKHRVKGGDEVVGTEIDYNLLSRVSLYNLPPDPVRISKGAWNFWKSVLLQERRDDDVGNRRLLILTQSFPVELKDFTYSPRKLLQLCNRTLFSLLKQDLLEVSGLALSKSRESPVTQDVRQRSEESFQEFLKFKGLDVDQPESPEQHSMDYVDHQFVIFEFCVDSVDIFIGNRQWNKIIERQNYRIYGLPSGRPIMPFKFTFGRDLYEMRNNCASCIWDLYVNKVSKDIYIDGNTKSGKFDISLLKKNIESFCHFASVSFFQGELSLDDQQSGQSDKDREAGDTDRSLAQAYNFEAKRQQEEELESYEQARPEKNQFLERPLDDEVYHSSCKASPTGYHEFRSNESLNRPLMDQKTNSRLLFASARTVDEILDEGVPVGLTVGETNQKTLKYSSLYKISPRESLVAFQQWRAILSQMAANVRSNRVPSISDLPTDQPREWNTPQYSSEKFLFVCVELVGSLLSLSKIKINLPHGAELDDYRDKARSTIKSFCREATNRYFMEYKQQFDVMSASAKGEPLMDESKASSKWSIVQEQVILDYISGLESRVAEVSPMLPNDFYPATEKLDFEYQCVGAIYQGYVSTPAKVIIQTRPSQEGDEKRSSEEVKEELDDLIRGFCRRASSRYYTAVEYVAMYKESLDWLDPRAKSPYLISAHASKGSESSRRPGSLQGVPWPPIKSPSSLVYSGRARPDLYRDDCFSYIWRVWESGVSRNLYIDGTSFEKCRSLDTAKVILEEFCTASSAKLFRLEPGALPPREVLSMEQRQLVGRERERTGRARKTLCDAIGDGPSKEGTEASPGGGCCSGESGVVLSDTEEGGEGGSEAEEEFKTAEKREAKRQWDQLRQQLKRDVNMNFVRFVKLPEYDQTLYTLWPHPVTELVFPEHCAKVLDELLKLRLAVLSSHSLKDREYTIERFCEECKFYVFSGVQEKTSDELREEELGGYEGDSEGVGRRLRQELLETLRELSEEGYPLYRWLESVMNLKSSSDRETLSRAVKWGQRKGDWHFLELVLRELDKEVFMSIQRQLQGISPQGFLMASGLFDKDTTASVEATWGAIYMQSLKDVQQGSPRVLGLVGSPPPREIWSGASNEQEFVSQCVEAVKRLKTSPPFVVVNSQGQGERGYIQNFCEDALDTLISIQRDPERILSMDFAYSGCVNEAMRKWQWNQIYTQMDIDLKESGEYRITGIPPTISHKIYKGGRTQDEVEDQCGDALEELDKRNKIKILNKNASQFCRDAAENICKEDETGKSNCNIERARLEEIISRYHMDTPIGNPLKLDSRTRCMRIWTLLKNSVANAIKNNIISTASMEVGGVERLEMGRGFEMEGMVGLGPGGFGGEMIVAPPLPSMESILGGGSPGSPGGGEIRFIALREVMDVCSPIDTPSHIIGVFIQAMRKIQKINSLKSSEEALYSWVKELVIRYFADERTDHEYLDLTGVNVFGDPYSKEDNSADMLNKGLHSRGIPKRVRELTDNEKAVLREKDNMRINSIVDGIVSQVLPSIAHLTTREKKREITDKALLKLQKDIEERDMLLNRQLGGSEVLEMVRARPELPPEERTSIALGRVPAPSLLAPGEGEGGPAASSSRSPEKIFARLDTRWEKLGGQVVRFEKVRDQERVSRSIERSFRKLDAEWANIRTFRSYVLLNIPKDRPPEYGDKGHKDLFNKEAMTRRCVNFFSDENNAKNYGFSVKGNYIERASHIRTHCSRSASKMYDLARSSSRSPLRDGAARLRRNNGQGKAVLRAGRLIHVKGEPDPLHQIVSKQRIVSGNIVEESEVSPEELEGSQSPPPPHPMLPNVEVQHVGSNDGYKAISSEYVSKSGAKANHRRKKSPS